MINPMVSVVIATYRREKELFRALDSLSNQTYNNFEIVLVDDNDNDEWNQKVNKIVSRFQNLNLKLIVNRPNLGSACARNEGINNAKGEYITFLDDDDEYLPSKIENQVLFIKNYDADLCITDLYLYNDNNVQVDKRIRSYIEKTDKQSLINYHLKYHMTGTDSLMFKKDFLISIGGFPHIDIGDEFYLVLSAIENNCKLVYLPKCDIKAYVHSKNCGLSSGENKISGENAIYEKKKEFFNNLDNKSIRFIKMRHFAVLGSAYITSKKYGLSIVNIIKSFISAPIGFIKLIFNHKL